MIDNYDSFTFNLVHYFRALGQEVKVCRNDQITLDEVTSMAPQYIVISPGPCDPDSAGISLAIIARFAGIIPILGVCLGHQCIAQHYGAVIEKSRQVMHGKTSQISHNNTGLFATLNNPLIVTRYHSLIVNKHSLPKELEVTAWSYDKNGNQDEIMALKHRTLPIVSVQFHPESVLTEQGQALLNNFITLYTDTP
ncbi:MAG: anthranilate synthase/aminodeoxychorismate synthase-like glutamine amidotransferase [Alteromonadaceae bacterium]|jgi:anthranilate synthase/aminodeoxychorismate synthase-like glutamine amidotransferase